MKTMFPREFVIWLKLMDEITFATSYSNLFHWMRKSDTNVDITEYTLDKLYECWLCEIKNKNKKDDNNSR